MNIQRERVFDYAPSKDGRRLDVRAILDRAHDSEAREEVSRALYAPLAFGKRAA